MCFSVELTIEGEDLDRFGRSPYVQCVEVFFVFRTFEWVLTMKRLQAVLVCPERGRRKKAWSGWATMRERGGVSPPRVDIPGRRPAVLHVSHPRPRSIVPWLTVNKSRPLGSQHRLTRSWSCSPSLWQRMALPSLWHAPPDASGTGLSYGWHGQPVGLRRGYASVK